MLKRSLKSNAMLNGIKTILSVLFPLITFPYATRVLGVTNLGKISFASSFTYYFILIAGLGIKTYAIREGSRLRNNPKKFTEFGNQMFTFNIISSLISYLLLLAVILFFPSLDKYKLLILIQSITIFFNTIGVEWIYNIYEDYLYITLRSLAFQILSLILMFLLVKEPSDYYLYAFVTVFSSVGSNALNFVNSKKYINLNLIKKINFKRHWKPIFVIFSNDIMSALYVNSDITLLGLLIGEYAVGIYSVSVKVYTTMKTVLTSILIVALPRLSYFIGNNKIKEYKEIINKVFNHLIVIIFPAVTGIIILSKEIIIILSGREYLEASESLIILSFALFFSIFSSATTTLILLPLKKEKIIFKATVTSAVMNVTLNLLLIPLLQHNGAAIATVIAELTVMLMVSKHVKEYINVIEIAKNIFTCIIGCIFLVLTSIVLKYLLTDIFIYTIGTVFLGTCFYFIILLLLKNKIAINLFSKAIFLFKK